MRHEPRPRPKNPPQLHTIEFQVGHFLRVCRVGQFDLSSLMESTRARKQNRGQEEEAETRPAPVPSVPLHISALVLKLFNISNEPSPLATKCRRYGRFGQPSV